MTRDPDPLDALREAWGRLDAPAPHRALADEDRMTQAAVGWVVRVWRSLESPPLPARLPLRRRMDGRWRARPDRLREWLPRLAAALFLSVLASTWWWARPQADAPPPLERTVDLPVSEPALAPPPQVLANQADRIEMRSGPVRLTLLRQVATAPADSPTGSPEPPQR